MSLPTFITFEGGEGSGKSTQVKLLKEALAQRGYEVILTREPGGSPGAELIRELLVRGRADRWDAFIEALLLVAARRDHWFYTISPALERGAIVICDRFIDSTLAYQGYAGGIDMDFLELLHQKALPSRRPDLTFIFDLDPEIGLRRAQSRDDIDNRFETKTLAFHQRLREGYLWLAQREPQRCLVIDATQTIETLHQKILKQLGL